jgi:hypothetical protein
MRKKKVAMATFFIVQFYVVRLINSSLNAPLSLTYKPQLDHPSLRKPMPRLAKVKKVNKVFSNPKMSLNRANDPHECMVGG